MMKEVKDIQPPGWAKRFLEWYCRPEVLEDLQGDLNEYFQRHLRNKGTLRARLIYVIDVFKFMRPYTVRKPDFINLLINWLMLGSYIKTSGRSIVRNKLFSAINITGLAISMSVGLLLIGLLSDMTKYDRFHENGDRIYRVISKYKYLDQENKNYYASTSMKAGKEIKTTISGIDDAVVMFGGLHTDVMARGKAVPLRGFWADESMFSVFSFPLIEGDEHTALKNPFSLVLTETAAKKLFGDQNALGQTVSLFENQSPKLRVNFPTTQYTVTGVIRDVPRFSHLRFEMLASLSTREITEKDRYDKEMKWDAMWQTYVYLLLPENPDLKNLQNNLDHLSRENDKTVENTTIRLALQPLYNIALGDDLNNSIGPVMSTSDVWMIGVLSFVVLLSACFNFTNLSIARSLRRSKEVGIRKVIGALKGHVLAQFIVEAIIISLLALVLAFAMFILLKPHFLAFQPKLSDMLELNLSLELILSFILLAIVTGVMAGFLPAWLFSRINAIQVLKNTTNLKLFRNLNLRKSLIILQYTISLILITATIIGFKQYKYLITFDLGYSTENIVNIYLHENKGDLLAGDLAQIPEVQGMSRSLIITSVGNYWGARLKYKDPMDSAMVYYNGVDENYLPLHKVKLIAGRNFTPKPEDAEETEVIVNEEVLKRFNIGNKDPMQAIDEMVVVNGKEMKIIGVIRDFHYGKAESESLEVILRYSKHNAQFLNLKVISADWPATFSEIEKAWKKFDDVHPLQAEFYQDKIERSYMEFAAMMKMIGFLAFLAICISSMGLLGMVVYTLRRG